MVPSTPAAHLVVGPGTVSAAAAVTHTQLVNAFCLVAPPAAPLTTHQRSPRGQPTPSLRHPTWRQLPCTQLPGCPSVTSNTRQCQTCLAADWAQPGSAFLAALVHRSQNPSLAMSDTASAEQLAPSEEGAQAAPYQPPQPEDAHRPLLSVDRSGGVAGKRHILIPVDDTSVRVAEVQGGGALHPPPPPPTAAAASSALCSRCRTLSAPSSGPSPCWQTTACSTCCTWCQSLPCCTSGQASAPGGVGGGGDCPPLVCGATQVHVTPR